MAEEGGAVAKEYKEDQKQRIDSEKSMAPWEQHSTSGRKVLRRKYCLSLKSWCHRIFPIQATCRLNEKELQEVVATLVKKFVANRQNHLGQPLKFAVGYNRRGIEETKLPKEDADSSSDYSLLDRNKCFGVVASAVRHVVEDSIVDLKRPELSILVEWLPLSGLPIGSIIVALSVLPMNLVSTKPRLCIKALTSNTKQRSDPQ